MEKLAEQVKAPSAAALVPAEVNLRKTRGRRSPGLGKAKLAARTLPAPERELLRIALHDGLGQLLTSISFLATSLRQKLAAKELPEAADAAEILSLTSRAISETQALVRDDPPLTTPP